MEVRRPDLRAFPGRYVALDLVSDEVLADAATMIEIRRSCELKASIVRAPREDEPLLRGPTVRSTIPARRWAHPPQRPHALTAGRSV